MAAILRDLLRHNAEFGTGAVLIGETIRAEYRGRAVGSVQSGWAIGWGMAVLAHPSCCSITPRAGGRRTR